MFQLRSIFAAFFLLASVQAAPVTLDARDISSALLSQLSFFSQYSAAAYCPENNQPGSTTSISCSVGNCPLVQSASATTIVEFRDIGTTDATGFVAIDNTNKLIIVSFRGSKSVRNFLTDLDFTQVNFPVCSGCKVHSGFLNSWNGAKLVIKPKLDDAIKKYPSYSIIVTGHSLGGAMATLAAAELRATGYKLSLYTFGSPMTGNAVFATFVTNQGSNYRVTHQIDPVPKLPGYLIGYAHVSPEYWITSDDNVFPRTTDISVSTGVINLLGNQGTLGIDVNDHYFYFGDISKCSPAGLEVKV